MTRKATASSGSHPTVKRFRKKIVAVDIGNTTAAYGVYQRGRFSVLGRVLTADFRAIIDRCAGGKVNRSGMKWVISSVVPKVTVRLVRLIRSRCKPAFIYVIGKNVRLSVPMRYARKKLGADRLVNIYGVIRKHQLPALVIDFGTAITFDYVSKEGVFEGGLIVPGVELSGNALQEKTALLPKLRSFDLLHNNLVGHDTRSAMGLGLLNGFGALADGLIERFRKRYGPGIRILATGGWAKRLSRYSRHIRSDAVDPLHTLHSLVLIYKNEINKGA